MRFQLLLLLLLLSSGCSTMDKNEPCSTRDSCFNASSISPSIYDDELYIQSRNCFCDSMCDEYGDCCDQSKSIDATNYECVDFLSPITNAKSSAPTFLPVWMRTTCLSIYIGSRSDTYCRNSNAETLENNPSLFIPVTSVRTNITYRNYYCAYCNNDAHPDLHFWEYRVYCRRNDDTPDQLILDHDEQVNYYIHNLTQQCKKAIVYPQLVDSSHPSVFIRPCKKSVSRRCPSGTAMDLVRNCLTASTAYRYDILTNVIYPNPYCAQCNDLTNDSITCLDPNLRSGTLFLPQALPHPLSILFNPKLLRRSLHKSFNQSIYSLGYQCLESDQLYNLFLKKCTQVIHADREMIISMNCSHPMQTSEEYDRFSNGSLYLRNHSIVLTKDQYVFIDEDQIVFCTDPWKESELVFSFYRTILSFLCTSISLVCLLIFTIAFWLVPSLHNFPGKCLLLLSISIFFGQVLFLSASELVRYSSMCFLSAIFIHYFYLSSFFWLLIITIHIHMTFNRQVVQREIFQSANHRLLLYSILVACSTGLFILTAALIQLTHPQSSFSPAYGHLYCLISKANAMILFFLVPIGCILLIITILFLQTILAIYQSHAKAKLASASSTITTDHRFVMIYARLACLMGLQWLLLIAALAIQETWAWMIFETVNSLPGVFICLGFLCSRRLWMNMKQLITIRRQPSRNNPTSITLMSPQRRRSKNLN